MVGFVVACRLQRVSRRRLENVSLRRGVCQALLPAFVASLMRMEDDTRSVDRSWLLMLIRTQRPAQNVRWTSTYRTDIRQSDR